MIFIYPLIIRLFISLNMNIGYRKYNDDYIIKIEVIKKIVDRYEIINKDTATYWTNKFKILSVTNWKTGEQLNKIDNYEADKIIEINNEDVFPYNLSKEIAIYNYFHYKNDEEIYLKNKCGLYTNYHNNGQIYRTFFHNNGIEEGEYKEYTQSGTIKAKRFYMNGKKYGESMIYHNNGIIYILSYYVNNILEGVYEEYYENGQLKEKSNFLNGKYHGKFESYFENGNKSKTGYYDNDKKIGEWLIYNHNGIYLNRIMNI